MSRRSSPSRAAAGGMDRKAEEEPIAELLATTTTPRGDRPADAQQARDLRDMPYALAGSSSARCAASTTSRSTASWVPPGGAPATYSTNDPHISTGSAARA